LDQQHWNCSSFCKLCCKFFLPRENSPYDFSRILSGGTSRLNKYILHTAQFPTSQIANLFQIGILVYRLISVLVSQKRSNCWYDSVGRQLHSGAVPVSTPGIYLCLIPAKNQPWILIADRSHQAVHSQFFPVRNGKPKNHQKRTKQEFVQESKLVALPTIPTRLPPTCTQFNQKTQIHKT
jgi:hypothetical protein